MLILKRIVHRLLSESDHIKAVKQSVINSPDNQVTSDNHGGWSHELIGLCVTHFNLAQPAESALSNDSGIV